MSPRSQHFLRSVSIALLSLAGHRPAAGQIAGFPALSYLAGSSVKLEQVIGDQDYQTKAATVSRTATRYNILGNGFGYSFEDNGKMLLLFGDTFSRDQVAVNYHAHDPIGWSTGTDPEAGFLLNFYTISDGSPLFIQPPGIAMGSDDIANSGISLSDGIYLVCNTGADQSLADPHQNASSILTRFDETAQTFTTGRTISQLPAGRFVFTALHASGPDVLMFGMGRYRASDMYLAKTPASGFWAGTGTQYFAGLVNGQPTWTNTEAGAVPVVQDNPLNGPAWPNDSPTIGNVSVSYSSALQLWLMTYDGGAQTQRTKGIYFTSAAQPWGPWSTPQLIFNDVRDNGFGVFMHNPNLVPSDGLNGPVFASIDPNATPGVGFAPQLIERFTTVAGNALKIYYLMSTWNPYTVVRMRSQFTIAPTPTAAPVITAPPMNQTAAAGTGVSFTVAANQATSYQWLKNGLPVAGATSAALFLNNLAAADAGNYAVTVTNTLGSVTSASAALAVPGNSRLINLSVRTQAGTGAPLTAGFVVGGAGTKQVLLRGIGPGLGPYGVTGYLADPQLSLHTTINGKDTVPASNAGWGGGSALISAFQQVYAFALPANSKDAALLTALAPGAFSAQVASVANGTGIALAEVYDADVAVPTARFLNVSALAQVGTGANNLIAGFVISGTGSENLLIRGIGPTLAQYGVVGPLAKPLLSVHTTVNGQDTVVSTNSGWGGTSALTAAFASVYAFALPANSADSALLLTLAPGAYTVQVNGANNTTGPALIEVYEMP